MLTVLAGYVLVVLATGQPLGQFPTAEACVAASYHVALVSGHETRCEPVYRRLR